ncbi:hypothetical protein ACFOZY_12620 [Chungangia koreensis]|uniref:Uncharacterized protein n=1 Tax=Chungangia koreensis TaxID=752657 RepID=A0ABV8X8J0_9LACT
MENSQVKVQTIVDLSHFELGETITGSVYLSEPEPFDGEIDIVVIKREKNGEDEVLDTISLNPVGDNVSKEVRKIPFMFIPDERWEVTEEQKIILQTLKRLNQDLLGEVEITYG